MRVRRVRSHGLDDLLQPILVDALRNDIQVAPSFQRPFLQMFDSLKFHLVAVTQQTLDLFAQRSHELALHDQHLNLLQLCAVAHMDSISIEELSGAKKQLVNNGLGWPNDQQWVPQ